LLLNRRGIFVIGSLNPLEEGGMKVEFGETQ
jgi:hypothetical protein